MRCRKCQEDKAPEEFHKDPTMSRGFANWCKSCMSAYARGRRLADPERIHARERRSRSNPRCKKARKEYRWRYRALQKQAPGEYTAAEFEALCHATGDRCLCCGVQSSLVADHVVPLSKGGANGISNIQPLCGPCNSKKKDNCWDFRLGADRLEMPDSPWRSQ